MKNLDKFHKIYKGKVVAKSDQELIDDGVCPECGRQLPEPVREEREGYYSESIIYCKCGATYSVK